MALATNILPNLVKRVRAYTVPVYDYALMTEPLTADQLACSAEEPAGPRGLGEPVPLLPALRGQPRPVGRLRRDLPVRRPGARRVRRPPGDVREARRALLHLLPQLEGVRFTHAWGGAIDTCSRFSAFFGTAHHGKVAYAAGYTGLGVCATRFGADVMLDLLAGERAERTELEMVRKKPLPFPPSPSPGPASRSPSGRWRGRTRTADGAISGSGRWTSWDWASTAEPRRRGVRRSG